MDYILIIGAKSDIARAVVQEYAKNGYNLYLAARKVNELKNFAEDLKIRTNQEVKLLEFDLLDYSTHTTFYKNLDPEPIGVIVATGYLGTQNLAQTSFEEAAKIIDTNYKGCVSVLNIIANELEKRKSGFIVGLSSVAGDRGRQSNYLYGSAKAAFTAYLSGLRSRLTKSNVRVLTVKPGFVYTQMTEEFDLPPLLTAQPKQVAKDIYKATLKKRDILYTKGIWKYLMLIIKLMPERIFKKFNL